MDTPVTPPAHTAGPWKNSGLDLLDSRNEIIGGCYSLANRHNGNAKEGIANAYLMAAAPSYAFATEEVKKAIEELNHPSLPKPLIYALEILFEVHARAKGN